MRSLETAGIREPDDSQGSECSHCHLHFTGGEIKLRRVTSFVIIPHGARIQSQLRHHPCGGCGGRGGATACVGGWRGCGKGLGEGADGQGRWESLSVESETQTWGAVASRQTLPARPLLPRVAPLNPGPAGPGCREHGTRQSLPKVPRPPHPSLTQRSARAGKGR